MGWLKRWDWLLYVIAAGCWTFNTVQSCSTKNKLKAQLKAQLEYLHRKPDPLRDTWTMVELKFDRIAHEGGAPWEKVSIEDKSTNESDWTKINFQFKIFVNPYTDKHTLRCHIPNEPRYAIDFEGHKWLPFVGSNPATNLQFVATHFQTHKNTRTVTEIIVDNIYSNCLRVTTYLDKRSGAYSYYYEKGRVLRVTNLFLTNASQYFWERHFTNL